MANEPKLTAPLRRYEIVGDSNDVNDRLESAYADQQPIALNVELADIYDGPLPVPERILKREIGMVVLRWTCHRFSGEVRAFGNTTTNSAETVTVHVPANRENRSILYLLDIGSISNE